MRRHDPINEFIREALVAGHSRSTIAEALGAAGWSKREIERGLAEYADSAFTPPIPRPQIRLTAREAFIYAVLFTALTFTATSLVTLMHSVIDLLFPDPAAAEYLVLAATNGMRGAIAILLVSTPVFVWMTFLTERWIKKDEGLRRSPVRRWLTYVTLFVSALVFLGDATYAIYSLLNGELTMRFVLKASSVALVSGAAFLFYLQDAGDKDAR